MTELKRPDWPTIALLIVCYGTWLAATTIVAGVTWAGATILLGLCIALHSSLTHEIVHGHPFPDRPRLNAMTVALPIGLFIPFERFRDTHLAHHNDADLTDPYDDPESNYLDPAVWRSMPGWWRAVLLANNTLLGRIVFGPAIGLRAFFLDELRLAAKGDRAILRAWLIHLPLIALLLLWIGAASDLPIWAYLLSAYLGMSIIKIRTFLEHQAHDRVSGRTAIVERGGLLSFMFLNNNLHVVHHMHPNVPWYELPALYRARADHYRHRNGGYVFRSYGEVFSRFLLRRKDPVDHPLR